MDSTLRIYLIDAGEGLTGWLQEYPTTVIVGPDYRRTNITVTFNTTGLDFGDYYANITISSNDPDEGVVRVPVHLTVDNATTRWDINEDGITNYLDAAYIGIHYGEVTTEPYPRYDINEDGVVNYLDAAYIGIHYGETS